MSKELSLHIQIACDSLPVCRVKIMELALEFHLRTRRFAESVHGHVLSIVDSLAGAPAEAGKTH